MSTKSPWQPSARWILKFVLLEVEEEVARTRTRTDHNNDELYKIIKTVPEMFALYNERRRVKCFMAGALNVQRVQPDIQGLRGAQQLKRK